MLEWVLVISFGIALILFFIWILMGDLPPYGN